jgi:hypothetical protein
MNADNSFPIASVNAAEDLEVTRTRTVDVDRRFHQEMISMGINDSGRDRTETKIKNGNTEGFDLLPVQLMVALPNIPPSTEYFKAIQKWEGKVISISGETFRATLSTIVGDKAEQEADIYINEVTPDERHLLEPGAVFYWSIGYLTRPSGRRRESVIRLRRLPVWTEDEIKKIDKNELSIYFEEQ